MKSLLFVTLLFTASYAAWNCKPNVAGKQYDFSSLKNSSGSYTWTFAYNGSNYIWQLQVCDDVSNPIPACKTKAPIYQISGDKKTCNALGDGNVMAWDMAPSGSGVMLQMYHGDTLNDITRFQSVVYFSCSRASSQPIFEHERICFDSDSGNDVGAQFHFQIKTPLAC